MTIHQETIESITIRLRDLEIARMRIALAELRAIIAGSALDTEVKINCLVLIDSSMKEAPDNK